MLQDLRLRGGYRYLGTIWTLSILKMTLLNRSTIVVVRGLYEVTIPDYEVSGVR